MSFGSGKFSSLEVLEEPLGINYFLKIDMA
jgi:hypothetical protein